MESTMQDVHALKGQDFVRVSYPKDLARLVKESQEKAAAFWTLPDEIKDSFGYQPDTVRSGVGYQSAESGRDPKEHFHVRLADAAWLREQTARVDHPAVTAIVETALELLVRLKPFAQDDFLRPAERELDVPDLAKKTLASHEFWLLRFLHYHEGSEAEEFAAEHVDKGAFTAHLLETDSGFERYTPEGKWEPVEFGDGETMIIAGLGLQYLSRCQLIAMHHRVVANERTRTTGRDSIVCFFAFEDQVHYDKGKWGPTQQFPAGYFYRMPFEEFRTYFIQ